MYISVSLKMKLCVIPNKSLLRIMYVHHIIRRTISAELKAKLAAERKRLRDKYEQKEKEWESLVNLSLLRDEDIQIYEAHKTAVLLRHFTYDDPETGYRVMTRLRHFYRGSCCGNACRHVSTITYYTCVCVCVCVYIPVYIFICTVYLLIQEQACSFI